MYCKHCGSYNKESAKFCKKCGCVLNNLMTNEKENLKKPDKAKKFRKIWLIFGILGTFAICAFALLCTIFMSKKESDILADKSKVEKSVVTDTNASIITDFTDNPILNSEEALTAAKEALEQVYETDISETLVDCEETDVSDCTYYRFSQSYQGIPVYGRSVIVGVDKDGNAQGLTQNYLCIDGLKVEPQIDETEACKIIGQTYDENALVICKGLIIYSLYDIQPTLAWQFTVTSSEISEIVFLSAQTGEILVSFSSVLSDDIAISSGTQDDIENDEKKQLFRDDVRNISVYDAKGETVHLIIIDSDGNIYRLDEVRISGSYGDWIIYDLDKNVVGTGGRLWICKGDNYELLRCLERTNYIPWGYSKAKDALDNTSKVYDFYKDVLKRNGFNNKDGDTHVVINDYKNGDVTNSISYAGDTGVETFLSFGKKAKLEIDLFAHEYTHAVEASISNMDYYGESGAIKEALSDIYGELIEDWTKNGILDDDCDWILNETRNIKNPSAIKSKACVYEMNNQECPILNEYKEHRSGIFGVHDEILGFSGTCAITVEYPDRYQGENYWGVWDDGGVHMNSTVISHAAYLMTHPESEDVEALSNYELAELMYHTMFLLPVDCSFNYFASYVCFAASCMELSDSKINCIEYAFEQVGLDKDELFIVDLSNEDKPNLPSEGSYVYDTEEYHYYFSVLYGENETLYCEFQYNVFGDNNTANDFLKFEWNEKQNEYHVQGRDGNEYSFTLDISDEQVKIKKLSGFPFDEIVLDKSYGYNITNVMLAVKNYFKQYEGDQLETSDSYVFTKNGDSGMGFGEMWQLYILEDGKEKYTVRVPDYVSEETGVWASIYQYETFSKAIKNGDMNSLGVLEKFNVLEYFDFELSQKEKDENVDIIISDTVERYSAYAEIVQQYELKYGSAAVIQENDWYSSMRGLCFLNLVDFAHNGQEELLLVYQKNVESEYGTYPVYTYEIWGYANESAVLLDTDELSQTNGAMNQIFLLEYNNMTYMVTGGMHDVGYYYLHGYADNEFGLAVEMLWEYTEDGKYVCSINGKSISDQGISEKEHEEWLSNLTEFNLNTDCDAILRLVDDTKKRLEI